MLSWLHYFMLSWLHTSYYRTVCLRTEGYQPIDLKVLVDRAISCAEQRCLGPILLAERNFSTVDSLQTSQKKDSIATLVAGSNSLSLATSFSVEVKDFMVAMETYVPASLKGLSLHSGGLINFKHVGGLAAAKQTLQETLLWPSKVNTLYTQNMYMYIIIKVIQVHLLISKLLNIFTCTIFI